jgi:hypothetical protein
VNAPCARTINARVEPRDGASAYRPQVLLGKDPFDHRLGHFGERLIGLSLLAECRLEGFGRHRYRPASLRMCGRSRSGTQLRVCRRLDHFWQAPQGFAPQRCRFIRVGALRLAFVALSRLEVGAVARSALKYLTFPSTLRRNSSASAIPFPVQAPRVTFLITHGFDSGEALTCGGGFAASPGIKSSSCTLTLRFPFWSYSRRTNQPNTSSGHFPLGGSNF